MKNQLKEIIKNFAQQNSQINLNSAAAQENLAEYIIDNIGEGIHEVSENEYLCITRKLF